MLDPWSLRILVEVAERGSFSAAADALVLTQPAVSRQISGLEARLGVTLFRREPRGVTPMGAGTTAVERPHRGLHRVEAAEQVARGVDAGHLRLTAFASVNTFFVPDAIRRFHAEHPGMTITLQHVDPIDALDAVRAGRVDLGLLTAWQLDADPWTGRTDPGTTRLDAADIDGVELVTLLDEELDVALPEDHRLAGRPAIPLADVRDETWIEGAHPDCLGPLPELTKALGAPPRIGFTCHDWNGKQALVAGGAGIMLVPTLAREAIRPPLRLRPTTPRLPSRRLYAAVPRPPFRTPPADAMLALLSRLASTVDRPSA